MACVTQATVIYVKGLEIKSATFYLDGRKLKTVIRADRHGRFGIKIKPPKVGSGVHRVKVRVVFKTGSQTKSKTMQVPVIRCPVPHPKFTG
jgi:hypothetical protein